jgi:hypothetical protein
MSPLNVKPKNATSPLLFSQIGADLRNEVDRERVEGHRFSFAATTTNLQPAIPPPFKKPIPSMESMGGYGGFNENFGDEPLGFNMLKGSIERGPHSISQEFMVKNNDEHHHKMNNSMFRNFSNMFASGEFGKMFDNQNEQPRNIIHPTPKYHNN